MKAAFWRRHPIWTGVIALASVAFLYSLLSTSNAEYFRNNRKKDIKKILSFESEKKALEEASKYESVIRSSDAKNDSLKSILDSLRMKRIAEIEEMLSRYEGAESFEERVSMVESAEKMYKKLYNSDPKNTMVRVTYHKEFLSAVSEYGGPEGVKDKSIELCDKRTYESVSSIGGADLQSADAERISEMTYEVNGFGKLRDRDMDGAGPMGGIRDRPVTCRVSWEDGQPEITYFDF